MIKNFLLSILFCLLLISCDKGVDQYNNWLLGKWNFNDNTEYIYFMEEDCFIMNDTIQGAYEVQEEDDNELWYYYISKSGNTKGTGVMICEDIFKDHMTIENLPLHEEETIKIFRKK